MPETIPRTFVYIDKVLTRNRDTNEEEYKWRAKIEQDDGDFNAYGDKPEEALRTLASCVENETSGLEGTPLVEDE